jgi:hypothetical protein
MRTYTAILTIAVLLSAVPAVAQQPKKLNPCTIVTKAEVQEAVGGGTVGDPVPNKTNAAVCDFKVGDLGVVSVTNAQGMGTADQVLAAAKKNNMAVTDAPGIGDRSFYFSPGYGMAQLNTFKGGSYVIVTVMAPTGGEPKGREIAAKVMQKALPRM